MSQQAEYLRGAIVVWPFRHAPEWMQKLSNHGGDEDWIIVETIPSRSWRGGEDIAERLQVCAYETHDITWCGSEAKCYITAHA